MSIIKSIGTKLSYSSDGTSYTALTKLKEVPDLGYSQDSVEVTSLTDASRVYIRGLLDMGDELEFSFWYDKDQFQTLYNLMEEGSNLKWKIELSDGLIITFDGSCSVTLGSIGVGDEIEYTLSVAPSTMITIA